MTRASSLPERLLAPLDQLRLRVLRGFGPGAIPFVRRRDLRVTLAGIVTVALSAGLTLSLPWWLLALGPVVWGVPHLVADLRYLLVRPGLHRRPLLCLAGGIPLALAGTGFWSVPMGLSGALLVGLVSGGPWLRKLLAILILSPMIAASAQAPDAAQLIFAHLHNVVAVLLWWFWRPRSPLNAVVPLLFVSFSLAIGLGWFSAGGPGSLSAPARLEPEQHFRWLAPGLPSVWAERLVLLFAFAQTVHYGVWLRLIPEDDRRQATPRPFAASYRALRSDLGAPLLFAAATLALGLAIWAIFDLVGARTSYLRMALFHGFLEAMAAVLLIVEGRPER
jgi:hypothetical protein